MNSESIAGAVSALRGYRTQFLFTLYRILKSEEEEVVFPEGEEDYSVRKVGKLTEVVQVKDLSSPLQLSDFKPKNQDSFFQRCLSLLRKGETPQIKIASFGKLGPELKSLQESGDSSHVQKKLVGYGYDPKEISRLFECLQILSFQEEAILGEVIKWLENTIVATDPSLAINLLHFWMYQLAEQQQSVNRLQLIEKIESVGTFLNERHRFLLEFGRSILQLGDGREISDSSTLKEQYNSGIAAQYTHILHGLDIQRPEKMEAIHDAFQKHSVVIIRGASGQGKSTLAYRYLHEYYLSSYVYCIKSTTDLAEVLDIAQAIKALARPFQRPFVIYLDVAPGDQYWLNLCQYLVEIPLCKILVTIREEDLHRSYSVGEILDVWQLSLQLTEKEAELIYKQFQQQFSIPHFLSFRDAWSRFGGDGPLLEFIYLLRQGERLESRLANQLKRIQDLAALEQDNAQVVLLRYLAAAGAHDCRLDLWALLNRLSLSNPQRTLTHFEDEYLFRTSVDGRYLEALHPVRARLMMKLLCDPIVNPVEGMLQECFPLVIEDDWGNFILQYAYKFSWPSSMMQQLLSFQPKEWKTCQEVLSSLIWCGVRNYVDRNTEVLHRLRIAFPDGVFLALMMHIAPNVDLSSLSAIFTAERRAELDEILASFTPINEFYSLATDWLTNSQFPVSIDTASAAELEGLGYILFWQHQLQAVRAISASQVEELNRIDTESVPISSLADLMLGLKFHSQLGKEIADVLSDGFLKEYQASNDVVWLEDDQKMIKIHFLLSFRETEKDKFGENYFNGKAMHLLRLLRKAFPFREQYVSQGYGHQFASLPLPYDGSNKRLSSEALPLPWITDANGIFLNLTSWEDRIDDWESLLIELHQTRSQIAHSVESILNGLKSICKHKKLKQPWKIIPDHPRPTGLIKLPKEAVDKWGYANDFADSNDTKKIFHRVPILQLLFPELKSSFTAIKNFHASIRNFLDQCYKSLALKEASQEWSKSDWEAKEDQLRELGYPKDNFRLSRYNLFEAYGQLDDYLRALATLSKGDLPVDSIEGLKVNLSRLLIAWTYFVDTNPHRKMDLLTASQRWEKNMLNEVERRLIAGLQSLKTKEGLQDVEIIRSQEFDGIWYVLLYIDSWVQTINSWDQIHGILRASMTPAPLGSGRRQVLSHHIKRIWVIPLFNDYLISKVAMNLDCYHILDIGESELGVTVFGQLTDDIIKDLDVDKAEKHFPMIAAAERFNALIHVIMFAFDHLLQIKDLIGKSTTGDVLLEVRVKSTIKDVYSSYKEIMSLVDDLLVAVKDELTKPVPYIPDSKMLEFSSSILEQLIRIDEVVSILAKDGVDSLAFDLIQEIHQGLSNQSSEISILYWSWLDMAIHRIKY